MTSTTVRRGGTAAVTGGILWALAPVALTAAHLEDTERGTASFVSVAASYWLVGVASLLLLLVGLGGLRPALREGRLADVGIAVCGVGLLAMLLGNGTEVATLTFAGAESDLGHSAFLLGFLVLVVGSLLLGSALLRRRPSTGIRWAAVLLVGLLPVGIGIAVLGGVLSPSSDAGFWAGIAVPTGIAWILLGRAVPVEHRAAAPEFVPAA
jgi:hypothetical protein